MLPGSMLKGMHYDYTDSYSVFIQQECSIVTARDMALAFFQSAPSWVEKLFSVRNSLARAIGLKVPEGKKPGNITITQIEKGNAFGLFKIFEAGPEEVIMGENDRHLNFRISLMVTEAGDRPGSKCLYITTAVKFNNRLGKCYFLPVKPLHKLIVPAMLRNMALKIEKNIKY